MSRVYQTDGLRFRYPDEWRAQEESGDEGLTVTVDGDGPAFCTITLLEGRPPVDEVLDAGVDAYREVYEDFDVEPVECQVAGRAARGRNVDFFCLELVSSAWLRAFRTGACTVLIVFQSEGHDARDAQSVFELIVDSLDCESDVFAG
ncbi:MAG: hypothetical protein DWQ41_18160 [Planctomycetota bacterium]|nr:MAG: hypothetical protein DWQ41_18160 [Planctomycetota bacterium]